MTPPALSVVVATRNRAHLLPRLVAALSAQRDLATFEVIVVDDASTDGTWDTLQRLAGETPFPLLPRRRLVQGGAAAARNTGWRAAGGAVVAFTDDDCVPQPGWVAGLLVAVTHADLAQGRTLPDPAQLERLGPFSHTIEVTQEAGSYETCNMAYRRSVLEALDGFGEEFRFPYGEDTDLAWRAKSAGFLSTFAPDALVHHDVRPSQFGEYLRDRRRREGMVLAIRNHPELRRGMWGRIFLHPSHAAALATAVGALTTSRRKSPPALALTVGAAAWYAWNCRKTRPRPRHRAAWAAVVPAAFVADLYEVAVVARAALRYRTPVL